MPHILTLDDEIEVGRQIRAMLKEQADYDFEALIAPQYLFSALEHQPTDLILLDVNIPGKSGTEVLRELKAHPKYQAIPVIMITGEDDEQLLKHCFQMGAVDFLHKPISAAELQARVASVLQSRKYEISLKQEIEERKRMQVQLVQAAKLASLGEMGEGIAHEINTPLSIITMAADVIEDRLKENDTKTLPEYIKKINTQVHRIAGVTKRLRYFAGKINSKNEEVFLPGESAENVSLVYAEKLKEQNIEWKTEIADNLPNMTGNPFLIEQVLLALLSNAQDALKESPEGGPDKIITLRIYARGKSVIWEVEDNGSGIAEEVVERIFDPFFTTKEVGSGSGLGLASSYGIVQDLQGKLLLVKTSESGSLFRMSLPLVS